ncbi:hypothetical protein VTN00DRAFT_7342 [Thermoascus crustaceus]|uniref:uncharacterized protein n=1 Tax=Thermoascus crustaceus TaxID=5088 RepID=UPI0037441860
MLLPMLLLMRMMRMKTKKMMMMASTARAAERLPASSASADLSGSRAARRHQRRSYGVISSLHEHITIFQRALPGAAGGRAKGTPCLAADRQNGRRKSRHQEKRAARPSSGDGDDVRPPS